MPTVSQHSSRCSGPESRGDASFASQLLRAIKDNPVVDINSILVQLNDGPLELSDWKARQSLTKTLIDKLVAHMQGMMPTNPSVDLQTRLEALERENAALKANPCQPPHGQAPAVEAHQATQQGHAEQAVPSNPNHQVPPPGNVQPMFLPHGVRGKPMGKYMCGESKPIFEDSAPTSVSSQSITPWLKKQFNTSAKMKSFESLASEVEEAYAKLDAGNQPQVDRMLVVGAWMCNLLQSCPTPTPSACWQLLML